MQNSNQKIIQTNNNEVDISPNINIVIINIIMWNQILGCLLVLMIYVWVKLYLIPKRKMKWYRKSFQNLGFRVNELPFSFCGAGFYRRLSQDWQKHGDVAYSMKTVDPSYDVLLCNFIGSPAIHILSPELMKQFYSPEKTFYYKKYEPQFATFKKVVNEGLIFAENDLWKQKRKIITEILTFDFIKALIPRMVATTKREFQRFQNQNLCSKDQKTMKGFISVVFTRIASNIVVNSFFGSEVQNEKIDGVFLSEQLFRITLDLGDQRRQKLGLFLGVWIYQLGLTASHRDLKERIRKFLTVTQAIVLKRIEDIKKSPKQVPSDILENLVKYNDMKSKISNTQFSYSPKQIVQQFNTFFGAGTDTSTNYITMMIYYLIQNPNVQQKLRAQIDKFIKTDLDITYENFKEMKYLECVLKETTRMYGPGFQIFLRQAVEDHLLSGFPIAKGCLVSVDFVANHYNPKYFSEPFSFKPQRWESEQNSAPPFALTGFGGGARSCVGKQFAMIEAKVSLIMFLKRYDNLKLPDEKIKMDYKLSYNPSKILTEMTIK